MIKVLVPAKFGDKEKGESLSEWIAAEPHVNSEYSIWPSDIINLDWGVHIERDRERGGLVLHEDRVEISAYGGTEVLVEGREIAGMQNEEFFDMGNVRVFKNVGRTYLEMYGPTSCELTVVSYGKRVAQAKLERVEGAEAEEIIMKEKAVEEHAWGYLREGTSDFG